MKTLVWILAGLQPVSVAAGAAAGYLLGPKVVEYVKAAIGKVVGDVKAGISNVAGKISK